MATAVRLTYPSQTSTTNFSSNFINYGNRYVYNRTLRSSGLVNLTFKAEVFDSVTGLAIVSPTIYAVRVSNDSSFSSYIDFGYSVNRWYELDQQSDGTIFILGYGAPGVQPTNEDLDLTSDEIALNASSQLMFIRGWPLSLSDGTKTVYLRFILDDSTVYPTADSSAKGISDTIILSKSPPSTPGKPTPLNSTPDDFVGQKIFWTYQKSQGLIANVESYSVDLVKIGDNEIEEEFDDGSSLEETLWPDADEKVSLDEPVFSIKTNASTATNSLQTTPSRLRLSTSDPSTTLFKGAELSIYNNIENQNAYLSTKFDFSFVDTEDWETITLLEFDDQWPSAEDRWLDVGGTEYSASFQSSFDYANSSVQMRYKKNPLTSKFEAELNATGLKPNFCYQLKLMGKPGQAASGLWDSAGDKTQNEWIGTRGRWWDYQNEQVVDNATDDTEYGALPAGDKDWVAGYFYYNYFVTDEDGSTNGWIDASCEKSYHVTWKETQTSGGTDDAPRLKTITRTTDSYDSAGSETVRLWFEKETDDAIDVELADGVYDVVFMITEESFHAQTAGGIADENIPEGGFWKTVFVSNWPTTNSPVSGSPWVASSGTDVEFTIGNEREIFFVVKNFQDCYSAMGSSGEISFELPVNGSNTSGQLDFEIAVDSSYSSSFLSFQMSVAGAGALTDYIFATDIDSVPARIDSILGSTTNKDFVSVGISNSNFLTIAKPDFVSSDCYKSLFELSEFPDSGIIELFYEERNNPNVFFEDYFFLTDADDSEQQIIAQTFSPTQGLMWDATPANSTGAYKIRLYLKNIRTGNGVDALIISAFLAKCDSSGQPINLDFSRSDEWNNVDTIETIFSGTKIAVRGSETTVDLTTTTGVGVSLNPGENYILVIALQNESSSSDKIAIATSDKINPMLGFRQLLIASSKDGGFTNTYWSQNGLRINEVKSIFVADEDKPIKFEILNNDSDEIVFSSFNNKKNAQVSVYWHDDQDSRNIRLASLEVPAMPGINRTATVGLRHRNAYNVTGTTDDESLNQLDLDEIIFGDRSLLSDISTIPPADIASSDLVADSWIFSSVPNLINKKSKWKTILNNRYTDSLLSPYHVLAAEYSTDAVEFLTGEDSTQSHVLIQSSIFSSTPVFNNGGGQPDFVSDGIEGWVGQDIVYETPTNDQSVIVETEFDLSQIKDFDESEFYVFISSQQIVSSMVDISRNYYTGIRNPSDFIRISISTTDDIIIYKNRDDDESNEEAYRIIYDIRKTIKETLGDDIDWWEDEIGNLKGKIKIILDNEKNDGESHLKIVITCDPGNSHGVVEAIVINDFLEKQILPTTNRGFYICVGSRVKNIDRNHSTFSLSNLKLEPVIGDIVTTVGETLELYDELNGVDETTRLVDYPDLSDTSVHASDTDYYAQDEFSYVIATDGSNCKKFVLAAQGSYSLGRSEINYCDQVVEDTENVKCFGVVVCNAADVLRSAGQPQRLTEITSSSGLVGNDKAPPYGDRRSYSGSNPLSTAGIGDNQEINLLVNARAFSQSHWICSEWQFYEGLTPWSANKNWITNSSSSEPSGLRESDPLNVDSIQSADQTFSFDYALNDQAIAGNLQVYIGLSNFKPTYRCYNSGEQEEIIYNPLEESDVYEPTENYWKLSRHDAKGNVSGNKFAGYYDQKLVSTAFCFGGFENTGNKYFVDGYVGNKGQKIAQDTTAETYNIMLPFASLSGNFSRTTASPITATNRKFMQVFISNEGKIFVAYNSGWDGVSAHDWEENDTGLMVDLLSSGKITVETSRVSSSTVSNAFNAADGTFSAITSSGNFDVMVVYQGVGTAKREIIKVYCETMNVDDIFEYLYPHVGVREKYDTGIFKTKIGTVKISSADTSNLVPLRPETVSYFIKQDGALQDDDLIYGNQFVCGQYENYSNLIQLTGEYPHLAQSFVVPSDDALPFESDDLESSSTVDIKLIDLKKVINSNFSKWRLIIVEDSSDEPDVGTGKNIPINSTSQETGDRPNTDIRIFDTDSNGYEILGIAYSDEVNDSEYLHFVFENYVTLSKDTKYWLVLSHPEISNAYTSSIYDDYVDTYSYSTDKASLSTAQVYASSSSVYSTLRHLSDDTSLLWSVAGSEWVDQGSNIWFKIFKNCYYNIRNEVHSEIYALQSSTYDNQRLQSEISDLSDLYEVDVVAPFELSSSSPPEIEVDETSVGISRKKILIIKAQDSISGTTGSGIRRFRVGYEDDFGLQKFSKWNKWVDNDADGEISFVWNYTGNFLGSKEIFVQIEDFTGNISQSEKILVDLDYGFLLDTEPPSTTRVRIEGDATLETDPNESEITSERNADVSIYAYDEVSDIKDFRYNLDFESDGAGQLVWSSWMPYTPNFVQDLGLDDGLKTIVVQFRDFADNADQSIIVHALRDQTTEISTALDKFKIFGKESLYFATTAIKTRTGLTGETLDFGSYAALSAFRFKNSSSVNQTINSNEELTVKVNSIAQTEDVDYTRNENNNLIIFVTPLVSTDVVTMDTREEVCRLYRFNGSVTSMIYEFSSEGERLCTSMKNYGENLYIGFESGNIYVYNGIKMRLSFTLTTTDGGSTTLPVGAMNTYQFAHETRPFLYVGSWKQARVWRYGGNNAIDDYSWKSISEINTFSETVGSFTTNFSDQTNVLSIEGYNESLFIGTGENSIIFSYQRELDESDLSITETVEMFKLSEISSALSGTRVYSLKSFGNRLFAGTDAATVFVYEATTVDQPTESEWEHITEISEDFLKEVYPWEYYESPGRTNPGLSAFVSTSLENSNYLLNILGDRGKYIQFTQNSINNSDLMNNLNNSTGWSFEFVSRWNSGNGTQGVRVFDGDYQLELSIGDDELVLKNGNKSFTATSGSVETGVKVDNDAFTGIFSGGTANVDFYNLLTDTSETDGIKLKVDTLDDGQYPYFEMTSLGITADEDTRVLMKIRASNFSLDSAKFYLQWKKVSTNALIKEKTYMFSVPNNNIWKTFDISPGWIGSLDTLRILVEPTIDSEFEIEYIIIREKTQTVFSTSDLNTYRISVVDDDVDVYLNGNNTPIIHKNAWLENTTNDKQITFGKIYQEQDDSDFDWQSFKVYTGGALTPKEEQIINWNLMNVFAGGKEVKSLKILRDSLIAIVNPLSVEKTTDSVLDLNPKSYILSSEDAVEWGSSDSSIDGIYEEEVVQVFSTVVWDNILYSGTEISSDVINHTKLDLIAEASSTTKSELSSSGNIYNRRITHAFDEIIKDTKSPETEIVIKPNENAGGIKILSFEAYVERTEDSVES